MSYLHGDALVKAARKMKGLKMYSGMCQAFSILTSKTGTATPDFDRDGDHDAVDWWKHAVKHGQVVHAKDIRKMSDVPAGTLAYWTGGSRGYGHAAPTSPGGNVVSTDAPRWGTIGEVPISWIAANWGNGLKFVGYIVNDGYGHQMVDVKAPAPKPPKPSPSPADGPSVTSASLNAASYNSHGAATYKSRTDRYVKRRLASRVDVLDLQEVGNGRNRRGVPNCYMRGRLDKALGKAYRRHIGADGRYCYSNPDTIAPIESGVITAAKSSWFRGDDKQAAYLVFEKGGVRGMDVSFHLENELGPAADAKRVEQMLSIVAQAIVIAAAQHVDARNILFIGDTNSEGMVAAAMVKAGWRNVADGTGYEDDHTYMGWDGRARKRFDYAFVLESAGPAVVNAIHRDTDVADHGELVVRRTLHH